MSVNVPVVWPAGTVTVAGTVPAAALSTERFTTKPPAGAALPRVTVPVDGVPPITEVGFMARAVRTGGFTVRFAVAGGFEEPTPTAEIVSVLVAATAVVVIEKVVVVAPAATVAVVPTTAEGSLDERLMVRPPAGAGPLMVTVPVEPVRPTTEVGFKVRPFAMTTGAVTLSGAVFVAVPSVAEMLTLVLVATGMVVIGKVVDTVPAVTVTEAGTVATPVLLEVRVTTVPPAGAATAIVTVPVEDTLPRTDVGLRVTVTLLAGPTTRPAV